MPPTSVNNRCEGRSASNAADSGSLAGSSVSEMKSASKLKSASTMVASSSKKKNTQKVADLTVTETDDEDTVCRYYTVCSLTVANYEQQINCDICYNTFHISCSGVPEKVRAAFIKIVQHTGWTCSTCKSDARVALRKFQANLSQLAESLAQVKAELQEVKSNQNRCVCPHDVTTSKAVLADISGSQQLSSPDYPSLHEAAGTRGIVHDRTDSNNSDIRLVVHRTVHDLNRRKCNVIVSGLPEVDDADDTELFTSICENYLSCKLVVLKCRRMGKKSTGKPRRLLIRLRNESAAQDLLKSARRLRQSTDPTVAQHMYINEDLSPEAAKLAFEARQR